MVIAPLPATSERVAVEMTTRPEASATREVSSGLRRAYSERVSGRDVGVGLGASLDWPDTGNAQLPIRTTVQKNWCSLEVFMPEILPAWTGGQCTTARLNV